MYNMYAYLINPPYMYVTGLDNSLRVFAIHKDVQMNMELSQGESVYV